MLVVAMVCLALIVLILGSLLKMSTTYHRQMRVEQQRLQAEWVAESALQRAVARLDRDASYLGEEWNIAAEALGGDTAARATIVVEPVESRPLERIVSVVATYPTNAERFARRSKQWTVRLAVEPKE